MKIECMRDPAGDVSRYAKVLESVARSEKAMKGGLVKAPLEVRLLYYFRVFEFSIKNLIHQYGAGVSLEVIREEAISRTATMIESSEFLEEHADHPRSFHPYPLDGVQRGSIGFIALALLLVEQDYYLEQVLELVATEPEKRSYLVDNLLKAFIPQYQLAQSYKMDKYAAVWMTPTLHALAGPREQRARAMADNLKSWCRIMRPWGWKPDLDTSGDDNLFCDFAFEVALAVCAYDIDDSSFREHPYYPRDLVEYYRANIRHTRDAWRQDGVGSGVLVTAPPLPAKTDLMKSKRKGIGRWIELACDGNVDATESVLEVIGKPRRFDNIHELMEALSGAGEAIHADIKDDETTLIQAGQLAEERGLGEFDSPAGPPFGPARCSASLLAFSAWLEARGYRLVDLDNDDDAWHAVVVKADYHAELIDLSNTLKIRTRTPEAVYND